MTDKDLKKAGLKITLPRLKVLEIFTQSKDRHLSAETVYQRLLHQQQDVSLATVYRVLTQFETAGLLIRHNFSDGHATFELDGGEHHDHLVCIKCHSVTEFVDEVIENHQKQIAAKTNFELTDHKLTLYGICGACRK